MSLTHTQKKIIEMVRYIDSLNGEYVSKYDYDKEFDTGSITTNTYYRSRSIYFGNLSDFITTKTVKEIYRQIMWMEQKFYYQYEVIIITNLFISTGEDLNNYIGFTAILDKYIDDYHDYDKVEMEYELTNRNTNEIIQNFTKRVQDKIKERGWKR